MVCVPSLMTRSSLQGPRLVLQSRDIPRAAAGPYPSVQPTHPRGGARQHCSQLREPRPSPERGGRWGQLVTGLGPRPRAKTAGQAGSGTPLPCCCPQPVSQSPTDFDHPFLLLSETTRTSPQNSWPRETPAHPVHHLPRAGPPCPPAISPSQAGTVRPR